MNETILMLMLALIMVLFFVIGLNGIRVKKKLEDAEATSDAASQKQESTKQTNTR